MEKIVHKLAVIVKKENSVILFMELVQLDVKMIIPVINAIHVSKLFVCIVSIKYYTPR